MAKTDKGEGGHGGAGHNRVAGLELRRYIERLERLKEDRDAIGEDIKLVGAEARAAGYDLKTIRKVLKIRAERPADLQEAEALLDMYLSALGMTAEAPLFRHVGLMDVDISARESVIEAFKTLVPAQGEVIIKIGAQPVRLWRDRDGTAQVEDYREAPAPSAARATAEPGARRKREVPKELQKCTEAQAFDLGREAAKDNQAVIANPFPHDDKRRPKWDEGWRDFTGSDGMGPPPGGEG